MTTSTQPIRAEKLRSEPEIAVGVDNGHGSLKFVISSNSGQTKVRCPSKFKEIFEDLSDYSIVREGNYFYYSNGTRKDLIGREFFTGSLAYSAAPSTHIRLSDNPEYKVEYALHAILGALSTLPHRNKWNLKVALSIHQSQLYKKALIEQIEGEHYVGFTDKFESSSKIAIKVLSVLPEGAGAYAYCRSNLLIDSTQQTIAFDLGTGTIIWQVFAPGGKLIDRGVLTAGGCIDLMDAIAATPLIQRYEGGRTGDIEMIRQGIENSTFNYGTTGINFQDIYATEVTRWLQNRLSMAVKAVTPWMRSTGNLVVWGGGAQLPGLAEALKRHRFTAIPNGAWANAIGLQRIAQGLCDRKRMNHG
ncbi:MAG: ParM/StbA family protein [Symploca sp. SIO1A3]|nr:ParM/StbA family protein [Symploca sp. SIO1A3]